MPQRVIKIILPENHAKQALELLEGEDRLSFWQEESSGGNFVVSALTDSGRSETIMDLFEKRFSSVDGFKLILFPVEASIPNYFSLANRILEDELLIHWVYNFMNMLQGSGQRLAHGSMNYHKWLLTLDVLLKN